jgi:hypothetical protein
MKMVTPSDINNGKPVRVNPYYIPKNLNESNLLNDKPVEITVKSKSIYNDSLGDWIWIDSTNHLSVDIHLKDLIIKQ